MSIPTDALRYAGIWDVTDTYKYAMFVVSPIDNQSYVWVSSAPVTGGADPSTGVPNWVNMPQAPQGDITGVTAGTGLSGGGSVGIVTLNNAGIISATAGTGISASGTNPLTIGNTGVLSVTASNGCASSGGQNPNIINTGVLSLDNQAGALTTKCGQWYMSTDQVVNTFGGPTTTTINFDSSTSWTNTSMLQWNSVQQTFTVSQGGVYHLQYQQMYSGFDASHFGDNTHVVELTITRTTGLGTTLNSPIRTSFELDNQAPTQPDVFIAGIYELVAGDVIQIHSIDDLTSASFTIRGQSTPAINSWDYNTFFSWVLIKPLP